MGSSEGLGIYQFLKGNETRDTEAEYIFRVF